MKAPRLLGTFACFLVLAMLSTGLPLASRTGTKPQPDRNTVRPFFITLRLMRPV